jgi:hypothetical protein
MTLFPFVLKGANGTRVVQLQELPLFFVESVPPAPDLSPLQALLPGDSLVVSPQAEAPGFLGQPDNVSVLPAIRLAIPTPARNFFRLLMSTSHLTLSKF